MKVNITKEELSTTMDEVKLLKELGIGSLVEKIISIVLNAYLKGGVLRFRTINIVKHISVALEITIVVIRYIQDRKIKRNDRAVMLISRERVITWVFEDKLIYGNNKAVDRKSVIKVS